MVQFVIDMDEDGALRRICLQIIHSLVYLSRQKFASNVIEKMIKKGMLLVTCEILINLRYILIGIDVEYVEPRVF